MRHLGKWAYSRKDGARARDQWKFGGKIFAGLILSFMIACLWEGNGMSRSYAVTDAPEKSVEQQQADSLERIADSVERIEDDMAEITSYIHDIRNASYFIRVAMIFLVLLAIDCEIDGTHITRSLRDIAKTLRIASGRTTKDDDKRRKDDKK